MRSLAGRSVELPQQLLSPMQRQVEMVQEVLERERGRQQDLLARAFAPLDAVFDLLEQNAAAIRSQAQALQESARSLERAAAMMEAQADLFEQTIGVLRQPSPIVKRAGGLDRETDPG